MWQLLQIGGAALRRPQVLVNTSSMTKTFGLVLGLIGFLFIGAVMAVLATEVNVVLARRLWPRALLTPFTDNVRLTDADRRGLRPLRPHAAAQGLREGRGALGPRSGRSARRRARPEPARGRARAVVEPGA